MIVDTQTVSWIGLDGSYTRHSPPGTRILILFMTITRSMIGLPHNFGHLCYVSEVNDISDVCHATNIRKRT